MTPIGGTTLEESVKALQDVFADHDPAEKGEPMDDVFSRKAALHEKYEGCRNCKHQIEPLRACEWLERGGDGQIHLICPKWERKDNETD
jgi:hypothetical protein